MSTRSKKRYHHIKFDDDDDFETPVFEYLNDKKESDGKRGESDDEVSLQDSEKGINFTVPGHVSKFFLELTYTNKSS